jgi:membrane-associated phospholipid phosphatase
MTACDTDILYRRTLGSPAWKLRHAALLWAALLVAALLVDGVAHDAFSTFAPKYTVARRVLTLAARTCPWWGFLLLGVLLLAHERRWLLLPTYVVCLAACFGTLHLLKVAIGRARPDQQLGPLAFQPFGDLAVGFDSFPSGHATQAVLWAALVGLYFPKSRWLFVPLAGLTCLSRLALQRHFVSDIVGALGLVLVVLWLAVRTCPNTFVPLRRADFSLPRWPVALRLRFSLQRD